MYTNGVKEPILLRCIIRKYMEMNVFSILESGWTNWDHESMMVGSKYIWKGTMVRMI